MLVFRFMCLSDMLYILANMRLNILLSRSNCRRETKYLEKKTHIKVKYYTTGIIPCYMSFRYMKKYN